MATSGAVIHWFSCCITQQPQTQRPLRPRIDRSMIGLPTDFRHTAHVGSTDVTLNSTYLNALQQHMQSKGGYETAMPITHK